MKRKYDLIGEQSMSNLYFRGKDEAKAVSDIERDLDKYNIVKNDILCSRILSEEIILEYTQNHGCGSFRYSCRKKAGRIYLTMTFPGESFDIFARGNDFIVSNVLKNYPLQCSWQYKTGQNLVLLEFEGIRTHLNNLMFIFRFLRLEKTRFIFATLLQIINILLSIAAPVLTARIIEGFSLGVLDKILLTAGALLLLRVVTDFFVYLINILFNRIYTTIMNTIEVEIAGDVMTMETGCIEEHGSGMIIRRMISDTDVIADGLDSLSQNLSKLVKYIGILGAILFVNPKIFLIKQAGLCVLVYIEIKRTDRYNSDKRAYLKLNDRFTGIVGEMVRGCRDVKYLSCEQVFLDTLSDRVQSTNASRKKLLNISRIFTVSGAMLRDIFEFVFCGILLLFSGNGTVSPAMAIVLLNYSAELLPVPEFCGAFLEVTKISALSGERLYQLLNSREFPREKFGTTHLENVCGDVEFRDVTFSYDKTSFFGKKKPVLNKMSFSVKAGETVAFVGKSGCGKSTTLNLITKFLDAASGTVLIDGVDIRKLDKRTIRENITAISQTPYIFNRSIRDNLRLVRQDVSDEEIIDVCKKACLHDEIMAMADGYDTILGEGGLTLSGGQRQRLAIARILLKPSRIVLLDEATSALDNTMQRRIQETITGLHATRTIIIVAHRLSTIRNCDRIFFISDGRVLAQGTHEQLLESCEEYRILYSGEERH